MTTSARAWAAPLATQQSRVLLFRVAALLAAQLFDFATFGVMIARHGILAEQNPLIARGFLGFGMPILALLKIDLVVLVGSIVVLLAARQTGRTGRYLAAFIAVLGVGAGLLGGISNLLAG